MIRSLARLTTLIAALAAASPVLAQEKGQAAGQERGRFGFGISLTAFDFIGSQLAFPAPSAADVSLNLDLGAFRLEPSLGISTYSIDAGPSGRDFRLGCGLLIPLRQSRSVSIYAGPRLFLGFVSAKERQGPLSYSDSGLDLTLAGVFGAEWFADPRFSIGAEARLSYLVLPELSDAGHIIRDSATVFGTSGHLYFRFYL